MTQILASLEPRSEPKGAILFNELDEFTEVLFFKSGVINIGFELNRKKVICIKTQSSIILADHGVTFNHPANFFYMAKTQCDGYSIRKVNWIRILSDYPILAD